jgi:hypothetical protein
MPGFTPHPNRQSLGFTQAVRSAFQFLEEDYGMRCVRVEEPTFVRYESRDRFVNISHGRGDYHVGVELGRWIMQGREQVEESIPLYSIVGSVAPEIARSMQWQAETDDQVKHKVVEAAELVQRFGAAALLGDLVTFQRALQFGAEENSRLEREGQNVWQIRRAAQQAWRERDYREVVRRLV